MGQISRGRFILGVGTGGYGPAFWASAGLPDRPIAVMRDYLTILRGLLAGETVSYEGPALQVHHASLGPSRLRHVPVYLGALGAQMLRLAGELAEGALLNWATPGRIAASRDLVAQGAARAGRDPREIALTMYIRVCVDEDTAAARMALGRQVLGYAMAMPTAPPTAGYRGLFTEMGFDDVLTELEERRSRGDDIDTLVDAAPDELRAMGGAPVIQFRLPPGCPALPTALAQHAGGGVLTMPSADVTADLALLVGWARENYVDLTGLEVGPPSLEDAYLVLTREGLNPEGELSHV